MRIKINDFYICDNTKELKKNDYFLVYQQNEKYIKDAKNIGANVIDEHFARKLLSLDTYNFDDKNTKDKTIEIYEKSANFIDKSGLKIIAITGTNGKTTTAAILSHILSKLGKNVFLCGTRGAFLSFQDEIKQIGEKKLTTPFLLEFLYYLYVACQNKCEYFVMEASSHAIFQNRFGNAKFFAKIYTNLTQDHLDFHKSFENYAKTKESFFQDECLKIINLDAYKINTNPKNVVTYGINKSDYLANNIVLNEGICADIFCEKKLNNKTIEILPKTTQKCEKSNKNLLSFHIKSPLVGMFNLYNILAAISCVNELEYPNTGDLEVAISSFLGVEGRMQSIAPNIIVDFAHTPDGIENACKSLQKDDLIVVMGAGGDRDATKRPLMAKSALKYAKYLILTSDNPRSEDPQEIINQMNEGVKNSEKSAFIVSEVDRFLAIKKALQIQKENKNQIVLILGKGDENYQEIKGVKYHFSDKEAVLKILKELN